MKHGSRRICLSRQIRRRAARSLCKRHSSRCCASTSLQPPARQPLPLLSLLFRLRARRNPVSWRRVARIWPPDGCAATIRFRRAASISCRVPKVTTFLTTRPPRMHSLPTARATSFQNHTARARFLIDIETTHGYQTHRPMGHLLRVRCHAVRQLATRPWAPVDVLPERDAIGQDRQQPGTGFRRIRRTAVRTAERAGRHRRARHDDSARHGAIAARQVHDGRVLR